jgi:hypothetical protein
MHATIAQSTAASRYMLVSSEYPGQLTQYIEEYIAKGWLLYGPPMVANESDNCKRIYSQGIIKPKKLKGP